MASILNVDQIGHSTTGTTAITIASNGTVTMPENDSGWIEPTLDSPYTNYGGVFGNVEYRKINNIVNIQGLINANSAANGDTIFTLPSGYRPKKALIFIVQNGNSATARIDITLEGIVKVNNFGNNTTWVSVVLSFMVA